MKKLLLSAAIAMSAVFTAVAQVPSSGLQLHYLFNGNLADSSGNGRNAAQPTGGTTGCNWTSNFTYTGNPYNTQDSAFTGTGCYNLGYNFGVAGEAGIFKVQRFTVAMWVKFTYTNTYTNLMEIGNGSGAAVYLRTLNQGNGYLQFGNYSGSSSIFEHQYSMLAKPTYLGDGNWHFVAVSSESISSSRKTKIYIDGNMVGEYNIAAGNITHTTTFNTIMMGSRGGANNMSMNGRMSTFSFYNRALSDNEVTQYYKATTPKCYVDSTLTQGSGCGSYSFFGTNILNPGTYTHVRPSASVSAGCDTFFTQQITIKTIPLPQVTQTGNTLSAGGMGVFVDYQWMKGNDSIPGATSQTYTITETNNYWVKVRNDVGCVNQTNMNYYTYTPCNMDIAYSLSSSSRCKDVNLTLTNALYPVHVLVKWISNPNSVLSFNINSSPYLLTNICPDSYTIICTDANQCKDSIQFTINEPVGMDDIDAITRVALYPNPANDVVTISNLPLGSLIQVLDISGKTIYKTTLASTTSTTLSTANLQSGVYLIRVYNNANVANKKLVISK